MLIFPTTLTLAIARACKSRRQALGLRQSDLASRSHVAETTIVRFERTGCISLAGAGRILVALNLGKPILDALAASTAPQQAKTGAEFMRMVPVRQRVRVKGKGDNWN